MMKRKFFKSTLSLILVILLITMMMVPAFAGKPDGKGKPPKDNEEPTDPIEISLVSGIIPSEMIIGDFLTLVMSVNATGSIEWQGTSTLGNVSISSDVTSYEQTVNYTASTIGKDLVTLNVYDVSKRKAKLITSYSFEMTVVGESNKPPVLSQESYSYNTAEDTSLNLDISASDDDALTFSGSELLYGSIDYSKDPLVYVPFDNLSGMEEFTITVTDTADNFDSALVVIDIAAVNDAPVFLESSYNFITEENISIDIDVSAEDIDLDNLVYTVNQTPLNGSLDTSSYPYIYTPSIDFKGSDSFELSADDQNGGTATTTININVNEVNVAPIIDGPSSITIPEDTNATIVIDASDPNGEAIEIIIVQPLYGTVVGSVNSYLYTPNQDYNVLYDDDMFKVIVSDGVNSVEHIVTLNVLPVNDAPVIGGNYDFEIKDNNSHTFDVVASDVDGDTLVYDVWSANNSTVMLNGTSITYTPESATTNDTITLQVSDGELVTNKEILVVILEDTLLYVALGDSIPSGVSGTGLVGQSYVQQLEQMYNFDLINESVTGYNAVDVKDDLLSKTSTINAVTNADVITLCVGANDIMDAAPRSGFGGSLDKYDIQLEIANTGRDNFEIYWQLIIEEIYYLNPDVQLITMTIYNPYNPARSAIDAEHYDLVDTYFTDSNPDNYGLNFIINNTQSLYDFEDYNYSVADVYTAFNSYSDKDSLTGFYDKVLWFDVCDPHPNQTGHNEIFRVHGELIGAM